MNIKDFREFITAMLEDYDHYLKDCISMLNSNPDKLLANMSDDEKKRLLLEFRHRFIEGCVTSYEDDSRVSDHIDG